MASAFFLYHLRQGFFLTGIVVDPARGTAIAGGFEYTLLVLAATVTLVLAGGGALALDSRRRDTRDNGHSLTPDRTVRGSVSRAIGA